MEYDPIQLKILMKKVASTLGNRLQGLTKQQANILDNRLDSILNSHQGQAQSITLDEIVGAYEIAMLHIYIPPLDSVTS